MKTIQDIFDTPFRGSSTQAYESMRFMAQEQFGIHLIPTIDPNVRLCHHKLMPIEPQPILGINFPDEFQILQKLTKEKARTVENQLIRLVGRSTEDESLADFLMLVAPLFTTMDSVRKYPIELHVERMAADTTDFVNDKDNSTEIYPNPEDKNYCKKFLPRDEWFDSSLNDLTIEDVMHIWPKAEQKALALCIGRALVGPDGSKLKQTGIEIKHAFRQMAIIYGANAGTGKSTFFNELLNAVTKVGYDYTAFNDLGQQFGIGEIVDKSFAYCDDLNEAALKSLLNAPLTKQIVTGNEMRAHVKFANDIIVKPRCVIFANVNNFQASSIVYGLDNGIISRLLLLTTRSDEELDNLPGSPNLPKLSKDSPELRTRQHLEWLSKKLGVSKEAIMLKFARLCAEYFLEVIQRDELEETMNNLRAKFVTQLPDSYDLCILNFLLFCFKLREHKVPGSIGGISLVKMFQHANFVINDIRANSVRNILKEDYIKKGRPANHAFSAIKLLDVQTVDLCAKLGEQIPESTLRSSTRTIKAIFEDLRLDTGFSFPANVNFIKSHLSKYKNNKSSDDFIKYIRKHKDTHPDLLNSETTAVTSHIYKIDFNRKELAEKLNSK